MRFRRDNLSLAATLEEAVKLNIKAFALTCAILWGFGLCLGTLWIIAFDGPTGKVTLLGRVYRGYSISYAGSAAGLIWEFFDGLAGGLGRRRPITGKDMVVRAT